MHTYLDHEAQVARFFEQRRNEVPHHFREVCARHPVLTNRQMTRRERREIAISQLQHKDLRNKVEDLFYANIESFDMVADGSE